MKKLTPEQERQLLDDCLNNGNKEKFVRQYLRLIDNMARRVLARRGISPCHEFEIEDLRNDVFLRLFENDCGNLRKYDPEKGASLTWWVSLIATQTVMKKIDAKAPRCFMVRLDDTPMESLKEDLAHDETRRLECRQELFMVVKASAKLTDAQKLFMKCHYFREPPVSLKDFAKMTGRSMQAVYNLKNKALAQLKETLETEMEPKN